MGGRPARRSVGQQPLDIAIEHAARREPHRDQTLWGKYEASGHPCRKVISHGYKRHAEVEDAVSHRQPARGLDLADLGLGGNMKARGLLYPRLLIRIRADKIDPDRIAQVFRRDGLWCAMHLAIG